MPKALVVNNVTYNYPVPGEDPIWGEDGTGWAEAVTNVLNTLIGPGDLLTTTADIKNNQAISLNVEGLAFDPTIVRAANIYYSIYRRSDDTVSGNAESGVIYITYDNDAIAGAKWVLSQKINGSSGVIFTILDSGQLQYKSTNIPDTNVSYSGIIKFYAKSLGI